jgi:pimeloyl-ACP methyl ester carboxylesterase
MTTTTPERTTATVHANGIDIHYVEVGSPELPDLVLLHGGLVSTSEVWDPTPVAYNAHLDLLASSFHVIAPDARGSGRTRHAGGQVSMSLMADDVASLIAALGLERPAVAGFSLGGMVATILAVRHPGVVGALVNDAGCDCFDPDSQTFPMTRKIFGGSEDASDADPAAVEKFFGADPHMSVVLELMKADQDAAGGPGAWKTYLQYFFEASRQWPGYGFADLAAVDVPALVLGGDQDWISRPEDAVRTYHALPHAELAILPATGHEISAAKVAVMVEFLGRAASVVE